MGIALINENNLTNIADAIRNKLQTSDTYLPGEMAAAIDSISGGIDGYEVITDIVRIPNAYLQGGSGTLKRDASQDVFCVDLLELNNDINFTFISKVASKSFDRNYMALSSTPPENVMESGDLENPISIDIGVVGNCAGRIVNNSRRYLYYCPTYSFHMTVDEFIHIILIEKE